MFYSIHIYNQCHIQISKSNVVDDMVESNKILYKHGERPDHCVVIKYVPYVGKLLSFKFHCLMFFCVKYKKFFRNLKIKNFKYACVCARMCQSHTICQR